MDDLVNFNRYHFQRSPTMRRSWRSGLLWIAGASLFAGAVVSDGYLLKFAIVAVSAFIGGMVAYGIVYFYQWRIGMWRKIRKLLEEGDNKNMLGSHRLILREDEVLETCSTAESRIKWQAVERIEENNDYIFLYVSAVSAHILPKRAFPNSQKVREFYECAVRYKAQTAKTSNVN
jgi:hypothetical protein